MASSSNSTSRSDPQHPNLLVPNHSHDVAVLCLLIEQDLREATKSTVMAFESGA